MPLKCGIVGLTLVGKTTIFNCFSNARAQSGGALKANIGTIHVPDQRLHEIDKFIKSVKIVPATVEIVDIPGLTKGGGQESGGNKFLADIQQTDAIIHVLRCFEDDTVPHIEGSVNAVRDRETVDLELQIRDLDMVERKILRVEKMAKSGEREPKHILEILHKLKEHLENFQNARTFRVNEEDRKHINDMYLLTAKPVLYVCNVDDESAVGGNAYSDEFKSAMAGENAEIIIVAGKLEAEIAELEDPEDRKAFLADAGLTEPGVNRLIQTAYHLLNLQSFFTAGPKEVRAWTIHKGENAQQASGVIHSDLERGFIRAEVMKYADFIHYGSEHALKEAGKFHIEGKNYIVEDGDIMHIRFNV
ncbi:MAG: redox-regulated ATPase YchF [Bacteroidales bacterium]|jgi:GTP-binding protein YchF|nr:redox-regulated ATPase YchF [Bacteroidales bacterium]